MNRKTPLRTRLLLSACSLLVVLLLLEGVFRVRAYIHNQNCLENALGEPGPLPTDRSATLGEIIRLSPDDRIAYELRPDMKGVLFKDKPLTTNSMGFRSPEYPAGRTPDTVLIAGIGDSIMFGHGVGDGESYMDRLCELLKKKYPQKDWRLINTAVPGYNTVMEVATLETKILALKPDLVIYGLCENDHFPPAYVRAEDDVLDVTRSFLWDYIAAVLPPEEGWVDEGDELTGGRRKRVDQSRPDTGVPLRYAPLCGKDAFDGALDRLKELSITHGFPVITLVMFDKSYATKMAQDCRDRDFIEVDMEAEIEQYVSEKSNRPFSWTLYGRSDLAVSPDNLHPSARLHAMAARRLLECLIETGWIDRWVGGG